MKCKRFVGFHPSFSRTLLPTVLVLLSTGVVCAQEPTTAVEPQPATTTAPANPQPVTTPAPVNSGEADLQKRIERARALAAAHKLQTAAHDLEAIRKIAADDVLRNLTSVMLMGIYLEEGNYSRAETLLDEDFNARAKGKDAALRTYFAIAGQAVQGARAHIARYRSFGLSVTDSSLPGEALGDIERLRSLLERMIKQAREIASERKSYDVLGLLEDVIGIRLSLPRDNDDRAKWETEYAGAREGLAASQTQVASLGGVPSLARPDQPRSIETPAVKEAPVSVMEAKPAPVVPSVAPNNAETTTANAAAGATDQPASGSGETSEVKPISTGSLNSRATKRVLPTYPPLAKSTGIAGLVRVYVSLDESGKVAEVTKSEGPLLLRQSAETAVRGWRFHPTAIDGKAVRLNGFVEFSFTL